MRRLEIDKFLLPTKALLASVLLCGCFPVSKPTEVPIPQRRYAAAGAAKSACLFVGLPGYGDEATKFAEENFVNTLQRASIDADFVAVDAHFGYYREGSTVERVYHDVLLPARQAGYQRIWVVGTSMGGAGALGLAALQGDAVDGVLLLAPYLGDDDLIEEIRTAGGLAKWDTAIAPGVPKDKDAFFKHIWHWAKTQERQDGSKVPVYLGFGRSDDLAEPNRLLGQGLPKGRTRSIAGGHGWTVWRQLWEEFVASNALPPECRLPQG
jgi:pimeloyl-ACP methyl ester carboxylesterase